MADRVRIWHPDYPPSWAERVLDLFAGIVPEPLPVGVDTRLIVAHEQRIVREFLDGCFSVVHLGHEMVRADTSWVLPQTPEGRRAGSIALTLRLRFGQIHPGGARLAMAARWFEFHEAPHGTRVVVRLLDVPSPHLRSFLAANLGADPRGPWTEMAVGAE